MENIYEWLFDHYAEPELRHLPDFSDKRLNQLADAVPELTRLDLLDRLVDLRMDCATAAFEAGVRLGLALQAP